MNKTLLISPCSYRFGGYFRAENIARRLNGKLLYPKQGNNLLKRVINGVVNSFYVPFYDVIYVFELMPETLLPALLSRLLGKKVILDIADEWLASPTYQQGNLFIKFLIRSLDRSVSFFPQITVTSDYLLKKYGRGTKLINGVDTNEFLPIDRAEARGRLGIGKKEKIVLSFGNTLGKTREWWLNETYRSLQSQDPSIQLIKISGLEAWGLALWLAACDLVLFPTGDNPCERACFPIRVGTALNAERVIATDNSPTEFHNTLRPYNCMLTGSVPWTLAIEIVKFFQDPYPTFRDTLEKNVLKAKKELDWDKLIKTL